MSKNKLPERAGNFPEFKQGFPEFKSGSQFVEFGNMNALGFGGSSFNPLKLLPELWYNAENIVDDGSGYAQQLIDLSDNNRDSIVQTGTSKPQILVNDLNGKKALLFDGSDDFILAPVFTLNQPNTVIILAKEIVAKNNTSFYGGLNSRNMMNRGSTAYLQYSGTILNTYLVKPVDTLQLFINIFNNTASFAFDQSGFRYGGACGAVSPTQIKIAGSGADNTACINAKIYEYFIFNRILTVVELNNIVSYFNKEYAQSFVNPYYYEKYDKTKMWNDVVMSEETTRTIRNPFASQKIQTSDIKIALRAFYDIQGAVVYPNLSVNVNGVFNQNKTIVSNTFTEIDLPSGNKEVEIIESLTIKPGATINGLFLTNIQTKNTSTIIDETIVSEKLVFITDSIGNGVNTTYPNTQAFTRLFKNIDNREVAVLGYGYAELKHFASDSTKINDTVSKIQALFVNATTKKLIITLGSNDYGVSATAAVTFLGWYTDLISAIRTADPSIIIILISPILRNGETSLLADYRTGIELLDSDLYINGQPILILTDLGIDGLHPTIAGHLKFHNHIDSLIL
jgi:lysophospholipase L1-like esterase